MRPLGDFDCYPACSDRELAQLKAVRLDSFQDDNTEETRVLTKEEALKILEGDDGPDWLNPELQELDI